MRRLTKLANHAQHTTGSNRVSLCLLSIACFSSTAVRASDINWGNVGGGIYGVPANWIGGGVPGINDFAAFGRTRDSNQQAAYTVSFSTNPSIQGIKIQSDRVTFDLNGHAHILTSPGTAITVGSSAIASGRLTIMDGAVATTADAANAYIGTNGVPGSLIITTGGQLLGPILWVGGGGPGSLTIQGGGDFVGKDMLIGGLAGGSGSAAITGASSVAILDGGLGVGALSSGSLTISAGGRVESTRGVLAQNASITGTVNVDGTGSRWTVSEDVTVGHSGQGTLNITGGGALVSNSGSFQFNPGSMIGFNPGSTGTVTVDGADSRWINTLDLTVGERGNGTLNITAGGRVECDVGYVARVAGSSTVSVSGQGSTLMTESFLFVGGGFGFGQPGSGTASLSIGPGGTVHAHGLAIHARGLVDLNGGMLQSESLQVGTNGAFTGQFLFQSGVLEVGGVGFSLVNQGGTLAPGRIPLSPASTTSIVGSYMQQSAAVMEIDIGHTEPLTFDQVFIQDTAILGGVLDVHLVFGFVPTPELTFVILDAANITGAFSNVGSGQRIPVEVDGTDGSFVAYYGPGSPFDPTQVVLADFFRPCPGDLNRDNLVDFFDYLDFLAAFSAQAPSADFNGDTLVDLFDYLDFVNSFSAGC